VLENRERVMPFIFESEGGLVVRPEVGRSNLGIDFHTLADYCKRHKLSLPTYTDHANLTKELATQIYYEMFFAPCHFDELKSGVDYAVVDAAINLGVGGAADILEDEFLLPHTHKFEAGKITFFNDYPDVAFLINSIRDAWIEAKRLAPLYHLRGKGWEARDVRVRKQALELAGLGGGK
jgi:lysozyme family protein